MIDLSRDGMADTLTPDICVIGGGSGAAATAIAAAAFGAPVVMVARRIGGAYRDKLPALAAAAGRAAAIRGGGAFGIGAGAPEVDFAKVRDHVEGAVGALASNEAVARLAGFGIRVIEGDARFKDRRTLIAAGAFEIRARRFVIATRSAPVLPQIPGLEQGPYLTSDSIFALGELPQHLIVIGAGSTGLELAQAFRRLGSAVTVLEAGKPLSGEDDECAAVTVTEIERDGVVVRSGVKVVRIERAGGKVQAVLDGSGSERVEGTHLLVATGTAPALGGLAPEVAGVAYRDDGIIVNKRLKTANRRIYAIGDAVGQPYAGNHHAGLVVRNALFRARVKLDRDTTPRIILTEPELAQAGLTEAQARERGIRIKISRWPYVDNARAQAARETRGHIKIVLARDGTVLGVTIVGAQAGELIAGWSMAMTQKLNVRAITDVALPSPTLSEIGKSAALDYFTPRLTSPWTRRIIAWLRIFG
jgi:pyruvate/2-oxoglutarate dehydrogenase complex dihydrolipoamide dehydrogenase (E3) component